MKTQASPNIRVACRGDNQETNPRFEYYADLFDFLPELRSITLHKEEGRHFRASLEFGPLKISSVPASMKGLPKLSQLVT